MPGAAAPQSALTLRSSRRRAADRLDDIRRLYFTATRATIDRDFDRAIVLLKAMPEGDRQRAAVFMEGLAQMRKEFKRGAADG